MKLEINNVKFKNFLSYGKIQQDIDFLPGINLVLGFDPEKERSNAAGKSSFLSAIPFALFGKVDKNVKKDQIVNWKNKKNCEVILSIKLDGVDYTILRAIKPDKLGIYKGVTEPDERSIIPFDDIKTYQKRLEEEILKVDYHTFMSLFYTNLNSLTPILKMPKNKKRDFLETIFGLDFSDLNEICNAKIKSLDDKLNKIKISKEVNVKNIEQLESQNSDISIKIRNIDPNRLKSKMKDILEREKSIGIPEKIEEEISYFQTNKQECKEMSEEYKLKLQKMTTELGIISSEKNAISKSISELMEDISRKELLLKDKEEYDRLGNLDDIEEKIETLEKKESDIKKTIKSKSEELQTIREELIGLESKLEDTQNRDEKLEGKEFCPLCGAELKDSDLIDHIKEETRKLKESISEKSKQVSLEYSSLKSMESKLDDTSINIHSLNERKTKILKLTARVEELKSMEYKEAKIDNLKKELEEKNTAISKIESLKGDVQKVIQNHQNVIDKADIRIEEYKQTLKELNNIIKEKEILQAKINEQESISNNLISIQTKNTEQVKRLKDNIDKDEKEKERLEGIYDYINCIKTLCKDEHVKQYAISSMIPSLNRQTNHYLSESGMNFYVKLDKWLDETIEGPGISNCSYGSLSGGEARSIDIALQFGFLDVARIKAGVYPDILILDELLDSSVDSIGLSSILDIVRVRQQEDNNKVFIITHRQEVSDLDVDNMYYAKKIEGFSYITLNPTL